MTTVYRTRPERLHLAGDAAEEFAIVLPFPESALFPNRTNGKHWATRQTAKKSARLAAFALTPRIELDTQADHALTITVAPPDKRRRDVDGILSALKPSIDGIAQALQIDDTRFNPIEIERIAPIEGGQVRIVIKR